MYIFLKAKKPVNILLTSIVIMFASTQESVNL